MKLHPLVRYAYARFVTHPFFVVYLLGVVAAVYRGIFVENPLTIFELYSFFMFKPYFTLVIVPLWLYFRLTWDEIVEGPFVYHRLTQRQKTRLNLQWLFGQMFIYMCTVILYWVASYTLANYIPKIEWNQLIIIMIAATTYLIITQLAYVTVKRWVSAHIVAWTIVIMSSLMMDGFYRFTMAPFLTSQLDWSSLPVTVLNLAISSFVWLIVIMGGWWAKWRNGVGRG